MSQKYKEKQTSRILTLLGRGGHHDGNVKDLSDRGVCDHRVAVERGVEVSGQVEESLLDVEDQEQLSLC